MANMSYCRFRNTVQDLQDCYEHLFDRVDELDPEEAKARRRLIKICKEIAADAELNDE